MGRRRIRAVVAIGAVALSGWRGGGVDATSDGGGSDSPLADLMNDGQSNPAEERRRQLEVEELTAECMRELGWEYEPVDWSASYTDPGAEDSELQASDPAAYGERYGYGIMRRYELYELPWESDQTVPLDDQPEFVDPNQDYVTSLSDSEEQQYFEDLHGASTFDEGDGAMTAQTMPTPEEMGCSGLANDEVWNSSGGTDSNVQERIGEFFADFENDPRLAAAHDDWVECMGDAIDGYLGWDGGPVSSPDDMWGVFDTKKNEAKGLERFPFEDASELDGLDYSSSTHHSDGSGVAWVGTPEPISGDQLAELTEEEVDAWRLDQECQAEADLKDIRRDLEQELVDQLLAEFPELATAGADED